MPFRKANQKTARMSEPDYKRAKHKARAVCRVAARAAERAGWLGDPDEIKKLLEQITEIDRDPDVVTDVEYKLITDRLLQRETQSKAAFAGKDNKDMVFTCIICLDKHNVSALRVHVPCGHCFCDKCDAQGTAVPAAPVLSAAGAAEPAPESIVRACCVCRQPVEEVIKAFIA